MYLNTHNHNHTYLHTKEIEEGMERGQACELQDSGSPQVTEAKLSQAQDKFSLVYVTNSGQARVRLSQKGELECIRKTEIPRLNTEEINILMGKKSGKKVKRHNKYKCIRTIGTSEDGGWRLL